MSELVRRWSRVCEDIQNAALLSGRDPQSVQLIAVSKKHSLEAIEELYHQGQRDFGENYVQELVTKAVGAQERGLTDIRWHFIGHLQRNKVKPLLPHLYRLHSLDTVSLVEQVVKRWRELQQASPLGVLIEVNLSGEESKSGISESMLDDLIACVRAHRDVLDLKGLMCIPSEDQQQAVQSFIRLRQLATHLGVDHAHLELSMGMSQDFREAIQQGSRWVRVGTAIFGPRQQ